MAKKQTYEEKVIADAAKIIMHTIHVASVRIADKYERQLMTEVVTRIQTQMEANEEASKFTGDYIIKQLDKLSQ
jgi:hypothetical protein